MAPAALSSNWKKLQESLKKNPPAKPEKQPAQSTTSSSSLKRKAPEELRKSNSSSRNVPPIKKARKLHTIRSGEKPKQHHPLHSSTAAKQMGAYVSTLPTASYALTPSSSSSTTTTTTTNTTNIADTKTPSRPLKSTKRNTSTADLAPTTPITDASQLGKYIALDCEMVGTHSLTPFSIRSRNDAADFSLLARASLVSYALEPVYDAYVLPPSGVVVSDYRTRWSGITPAHLDPARANSADPAIRAIAARPFEQVQREVAALLEGRVLVGHALANDLAVLGLSHPRGKIRDTARHAPFRVRLAPVDGEGKVVGRLKAPSLKRLTKEVLGWDIQGDEVAGHSSVEDARAAMALYKYDKAGFEKEAMGRPGGGQAGGGRGGRRTGGR